MTSHSHEANRGMIMRAIFNAILFLVLMTFSGQAYAEQVVADLLNCRSRPDATASVVAKLARGRHVEVSEAGGGWSHIVSPNCWVVARFLTSEQLADTTKRTASHYGATRQSYGTPSYFTSTRQYASTRKSSLSSRKKKSSSSRRGRSSGSYGGACPCSGGNVCIGPRGGRYCITSGGNKRYGV